MDHGTVRFSILGPLTVLDGAGAPVPVGGARLRRLLVLLLLEPGRTVGADRLIDGIWGADAPANAANALQALVSRLRRQLGSPSAILGDAAGYRLDADPSQVDLWEFDGLVRRGRRARAAGDRQEAVRLLEAALELWRGDPVPELGEAGGEGEAARLAEQYRGARVELLEARLEGGEHGAVLPELEALAAQEPLREHTTELLIRALAGSGRTADALDAYQRLRSRLAEELGIDPSERLSGLHLKLLRGEALGSAAPVREPLDLGARPAPVTRLPSMLTSFVAREEVGAALGLLTEERLLTLVGPGGAGKTRLSVEVGGRLAADRPDLVPDGVWFVDLSSLRAEGGVPVTLLDVVGMRERVVSPLQIAEHTDPIERALEVFGDKRLLLIVDNCEHLIDEVTDVVARMLPACPGVRIMATSREPIGITGERLLAVPPLELPRRAPPPRRPAGTRRCSSSPTGCAPSRPASRWTTATPRRWCGSAGSWTGCRWPWSWPRSGCARCRFPSWPSGSPTGSGCWPAAPARCGPGTRRWRRWWTGAGSCWTRRSGRCCAGWRCSAAARPWTRWRRSAPTATGPVTSPGATCGRCSSPWWTSRW
ncbi:BTAD domain-containing putative transcriptional regulator [Nocardiopsis composta]